MSGRSKELDGEQRYVAELLRSFDAPAPERLHVRVESLVAERRDARRLGFRFSPRVPRPRQLSPLGLAGAVAAAIAVVAVAVTAGLGSGSRTLSLKQAAEPTLRAATLPAPRESRENHTALTAAVDGVRFPYWGERFGWRSTGTRRDQIGGRAITTVFYANASGQRIGYAILAGTPAPRIAGGRVVWRGGVQYRLLSENGALAVVWQRQGRLCVVSGHGVPGTTLLRLASWSDVNATPS